MANVSSAALGSIGFAFELIGDAPGEQIDTPPGIASDQSILAYGAVAATASATNQPSGSGGMRCHIYVYNNSATGTVTITGKDINGNALAETTPIIPIAPVVQQSQETGRYDYCTTAVYGSINASGITTTGLTGGSIKIGGIYAAKFALPGTLKVTPKYGEYSPDEHRGIGDRYTRKIQTIKDVSLDLDMAMYPDSSVFVPYAIVNSATSPSTLATTPGTPVVNLASTAIAGSPLSLTTQPTAPGQKFILVMTGSSAVGTIALAGTDMSGNAQSETIVAGVSGVATNANGTYYSANVYKTLNAGGITVTGATSGSLAISSVFAWNRAWLPAINPFSLTTEWFLGSESVVMPMTAFSEVQFDYDDSKDFTMKAKAVAQDRIPIGSRIATPLTTSNVVAVAQPTDRPMAAWACTVYFDPISGIAGTTTFGTLLSGSIKIQLPTELVHTMNNRQVAQMLARGKWDVEVTGKAIYTDVVQLENFRQDAKQWLQLNFYGKSVGAGNLQTISFIVPFKFNKFDPSSTPSMKFPEVEFGGIGEYDPTIGASYKMLWNNSYQPPSYIL